MPSVLPVPDKEAERLACLQRYRILDSRPTEAFDRIARLASRLLQVPVATVALADRDRLWFKAKVGTELPEVPRLHSFCNQTIRGNGIFVVEQAHRDPRFAEYPFVCGEPFIRFYAGVPLTSPDGHNVGTLSVLDLAEREFTAEDRLLLKELANIVVDEMELHLLVQQEQESRNRLYDAIDAAPDGFVFYDAEDRMILCNRRYLESYPESADLMVPGMTFEQVIRQGVARGQFEAAKGNEEKWIAQRMEAHRNPTEPFEQQLCNGRWMRIQERRTREGGIVGFRTDITELKEREFALRRLATTDPLTGAMNRRRFMETGERELRRARRYGAPVSTALLDLDFFKRINDTHGHAAGDKVLRRVVEEINATLREHDLICRYGGEEFALLFPETDAAAAEVACERLRLAVEALVIVVETGDITPTVSIGVTQIDPHDDSLESALSRADSALYEAKDSGRNRICYHHSPSRQAVSAE